VSRNTVVGGGIPLRRLGCGVLRRPVATSPGVAVHASPVRQPLLHLTRFQTALGRQSADLRVTGVRLRPVLVVPRLQDGDGDLGVRLAGPPPTGQLDRVGARPRGQDGRLAGDG